MKAALRNNLFLRFVTERSIPFIRENGKIITQFILTLFFVGIGVWFIKNERAELMQVRSVLSTAQSYWVWIGLGLTIVYIILQGLMYVSSFSAVQSKVSLFDASILFLKRNLISVFLPAGGISSLAFFTGAIKKKGVRETQIHFASTIYGFVGILSVVLVAIPAFIFAMMQGRAGASEWYALFSVLILLALVYALFRSIMLKGKLYAIIVRYFPSSQVFMDDLSENKIETRHFALTIFYSVLIECTGIAHLYIAMIALNLQPSLFASVMAYIISVIFLIISPFLRGLGAIEVSMTYILIRFGFGNVEAIAVTFLYRFFEFWAPLITGIIAFMMKINKLLMRVVPAILILVLGIVNIISILTPAIAERLHLIKTYVPIEAIHASNYLVMISGLFLLLTAAFMLKGLRTAWWFGLVLSVISLFGHLFKAIDYEEAIVALVVIVILLFTRKEYYVKNNPRLGLIGLQTSVLSILAVIIYGIIGFYFLNKNHFHTDFSWYQSIRYTIQNFFLIGSDDLVPADAFARQFLASIKISGVLSMGFLIYTLVRPHIPEKSLSEEDKAIVMKLLNEHGNSALDYFKTYFDKLIFISENNKACIAYRIAGNFAVALANPIAENDTELKQCVMEFDQFCYKSGLKSIYYRVPEESLEVYKSLNKKSLFLGQEGVVDITDFSMEGSSRKSMRNALKKVAEKGYKSQVYEPPIKDGLLQKIKSVSDEWLVDTERNEIIFSQGMFLWDELKDQVIITVENAEEKIVAFLNVIPDFADGEATYDLLRKTKDAPNGVMDFILVDLITYLKEQNFNSINLGLAPMSGLESPQNFPEQSMKFAYEKIRSFSHYKGLRDYKEKFLPTWHNQYLIYSHDYDLLQIPGVMSKVIKP